MRETLKQIKIPVLYTFARSGGTLINRCLGCIPGNIVLSEVNPHASVVPIEVQARDWFNLLSPNDFSEFAKEPYAKKIRFLAEAAQQQGSSLIIRDWSTLNFLPKALNNIYIPSKVLEQELYLSQYSLNYRSVVIARRSADVYESILRTFGQFQNLSAKEFGSCYLAYAQAVSAYPVFHYENFCREPEKELGQLCETLGINYSDSFVTEFSEFKYCTGDNTVIKPSRGSKFDKITVMESRQDSESYIAASLDENCQLADQLLGYENMEMGKQVDALWKIVQFRDQALIQANDLSQQTQAQLQQTQAQLQQTQAQLQQTQAQLQQLSQQTEASLAEERRVNQEFQNRNRTLEACLEQEKQLVSHLQDQLQSLNVVRSRLINELYQSNDNLQQSINELKASNHNLQQNINELQAGNSHLQQEIEFISTNKAAVRKLIKTFFKKTGIYNFVYRQHNLFVPIYNLLFSDRWKPSTIFQPNSPTTISALPEAQIPNLSALNKNVDTNPKIIDINSPIVEAFVSNRSFGENITFEASEFLSNWLAEIHQALCIHPSAQSLHLLHLLSKADVKITCVDCKKFQDNLITYGFETIAAKLGEWMISAGTTNFYNYDLLLLDAQAPEETLMLLKSRLTPKMKILVFGVTSDSSDRLLKLGWECPHTIVKGLHLYDTPPEAWLNAFCEESTLEAQLLQWPWNYSVPKVSPTLPSGKPWPKISVVTVTLNQGAYVEETLRSVLLQGYPNLEYIVIDGGSSDNTPTILERYRSQLTYCVSEPDQGQSHALNKGFSRATGDILAWLNSDDRYLPGTLFQVAIAFDTYGTDIVAGGCLLTHGSSQTPLKTHHNAMPIGKVVSLPLERLLDIDGSWQKGDFFYQPEVFFTREIWERSGAQVDKSLFYSMDYELWLRMAYQEATIVHIPDPLALFRVHEKQKTHGDAIPFLPELKEVNTKFQRQFVECNICGWQGKRFISDDWHPHTICPNCGSQVRHRLLVAALSHIEQLSYANLVKTKRILHFAPEWLLRSTLQKDAAKYITADFLVEGFDLKLDISNMSSIQDCSVDLVIACDVLEHVPEDRKAMQEIYRILSISGYAILTVPQKDYLEETFEDPNITDPQERERVFGQSDHLRIYGANFSLLLESVGFNVIKIDESSFPKELVNRHILFPPVLSKHPLATNYRKVFFAHKA